MVVLITLMIIPHAIQVMEFKTSDLEQASDILSKWFIDNYLKANPDILCPP